MEQDPKGKAPARAEVKGARKVEKGAVQGEVGEPAEAVVRGEAKGAVKDKALAAVRISKHAFFFRAERLFQKGA